MRWAVAPPGEVPQPTPTMSIAPFLAVVTLPARGDTGFALFGLRAEEMIAALGYLIP